MLWRRQEEIGVNLGVATPWCAMRKDSETKVGEKGERKGKAVASTRAAQIRGYHRAPAQPRVLSQPICKTSNSTECTSTLCRGRGTCEEKVTGASRDTTENESAWLSSVYLLQGSPLSHSHNLIHPPLCA